MSPPSSIVVHAVLVSAVIFLSAPFVRGQAQDTVTCYTDSDGDGYGVGPSVKFMGNTCPFGYGKKNGDCKEFIARIHPGRGEIGYNGEDDNCVLGVDEPTFRYFDNGNQNTVSSFRMTVSLNDSAILAAAFLQSLYVEIEYAKLSDSANPVFLPKTRVTEFGGYGDRVVHLTVPNLESMTPYRARVTFSKKLSANAYQGVGGTSGWYYTLTDGATFKTNRRAWIVLKGFKELDESNNERVGYRGSEPDGTRYGAEVGEQWCSEFYVWVVQTWLPGVAGLHNWEQLRDFFLEAGSYYAPSEIPTRAAPGDYLPLDTDREGRINHSGMFLAYDASVTPAQVWSLEGNAASKVQVRARALTMTTWTPSPFGPPVLNIGTYAGLGYVLTSLLQ